jgi:hypothetical protein
MGQAMHQGEDISHTQATSRSPRVLGAEGNVILAMDLEVILISLGCQTVGPFSTIEQSLNSIVQGGIDIALLDFHVGSEGAGPLASVLDQKAIPYALCDGRSWSELAEKYPNTPILAKPYSSADVSRVIDSLMAARLGAK